MTRRITILLSLWLLALALPAQAELNLFACEPEWAALADELGGDRVEVYAATTALQDPHHIEARPSLIAKVRKADLLVCSGAELEIGWLPMLQRQAGNPQVLAGRPGYFAASDFVERLDVPDKVDRSMGDVHATGNPHVHLDPRRLLQIAEALSRRLQEMDPAGTDEYRRRMDGFSQRWLASIQHWETRAAPLRGIRVVVHHRDWSYLFDWLGVLEAGTLEPRPGLPTSAGHLVELKNTLAETPAKLIIHTAYQTDRPAKRLAEMSGLPVVELPYTVGGTGGAHDLFGLFEVTLNRLLDAIK